MLRLIGLRTKLNIPFEIYRLSCSGRANRNFLGRLANFANDELWGRQTDVPWAIRFPRGGYIPRHPSQLYEACLEGIGLFILLNLLWKSSYCRGHTGMISSAFLLGYAICRMLVEQYREPDAQLGFLWLGLTMGQ